MPQTLDSPHAIPDDGKNHDFKPCDKAHSRGPCPGLNAMANHGYLPRSGTNIGFFALKSGLQQVYNLSFPLAAFLSGVALAACGRGFFFRTLDLEALGLHNKLEHDASLVHQDAAVGCPFAPKEVDQKLLQQLLTYAAPGHGMTLDDFARVRHDREAQLQVPLTEQLEKNACAEAVITWLVLKQEGSGEVPLGQLRQLYGEERLPDGWKRPKKPIGLFEALGLVKALIEKVAKLRDPWKQS
ncbi:hypothetical protein HGRIS_007085 [Hohenbuehelia grisea]|uniref:Heme haloperoxidase family profile domain-containing protein n=1 Tax=Hohenbuehelia grisea TaxID=104357 RepID=A0ABR3JB03_9AGAR